MNSLSRFALIACLVSAPALSGPSVFPTGTTRYDPDKAFNGFTVLSPLSTPTVVVIDMNGRVVKTWEGVNNSAGGPARILPNGDVISAVGARPPHQESLGLVQLDFDGNEVWRFDHNEQVENADGEMVWSARQHHDWQRPGLPGGYYAPGSEPAASGSRTLILTHTNLINAAVTDQPLEDDRLIEVSWDGEVTWDWRASDHVDELGFSEAARDVIRRAVGFNRRRNSYDWLHTNAAAYVGPNHWYDEGDERFAPDNIIISSRESNIVAIVDHRSGAIVWRLGPDYRASDALAGIGQIIGQHNPHVIPAGLPGEGNVLIFDNGGAAGYGFPTPASPEGRNSVTRDASRVVEINPVTLEKVWEYAVGGVEHYRFASHYVSGAQRLTNGNTMITEGADGRIFEVTPDGDVVWEYVSPYFTANGMTNRVYRAYRVPYDWIPQVARPVERAVVPPDVREFHIEPQ